MFIKKIFLTLEEEFCTSARPCNILYISLQIDLIMVTRLIFLIFFDIFCMLSLLSLLSMCMLIYKAFFNFQLSHEAKCEIGTRYKMLLKSMMAFVSCLRMMIIVLLIPKTAASTLRSRSLIKNRTV